MKCITKNANLVETVITGVHQSFYSHIGNHCIISLVTDVIFTDAADRDYKTLIVVSIMVLLSGILRFIQEFRSNRAAEQLKSTVRTTAGSTHHR